MKDPVNNFEIPPEWIKRCVLPEETLEEGVRSGKLVLLSTGEVLHRGYTTGTTAAAAAKAAVLSLKAEGRVTRVTVKTPIGLRVTVPVVAEAGCATAVKDSGDHEEDVTAGIEITASARESERIDIVAGEGIGVAGRCVFHLKEGEPAINPTPKKQILEAVREAVAETKLKGVNIMLKVPKGAEIARKTLNSDFGITGGISILGTTGFVEPWSEHLQVSKEELIRQAENTNIVLTTGRKGVRYAHMLFPDYTVILVGKHIQKSVEVAESCNKNVILCGLPALILKWANPALLKQTGCTTVQELLEKNPKHPLIARSISKASEKHGIRIVLIDRKGTITHDTQEASLE
jgi:cobalt-precorrin-5B (C1)-methyltransferase